MRQFAAAMVDIKAMHSQMQALFREGIAVLLPETSATEEGKPTFLISGLHRKLIISIRCIEISDIVIRRSHHADAGSDHYYLDPTVL